MFGCVVWGVVAGLGLGERWVVGFMRGFFEVLPGVVVGFGDDVSVVELGGRVGAAGLVGVLKADMLVGATDVPFGMGLWEAARKAAVMNVSDFAAKGVEPLAVLVSLGLQRGFSGGDLEAIARGLNAGAREYGAYVVGGDTGEASDLVMAVNLFGISMREGLMLRSGARVGDVVCVTGFFGKSAAGLKLMVGGDSAFKVSDEVRKVLVDAVCLPRARLREGLALRGSGAVTASIDSSDGLAWCLHELAGMSRVGFVVSDVPVADEVKRFAADNGLDALELALYGGEEYELVFTVKPDMLEKAKAAVESVGGMLLPIGEVTAEKQVLLDVGGKKRIIEARGYEHFKS